MNKVKLFAKSNDWTDGHSMTEQRIVCPSNEQQIQSLFEENLYSLLGVHLLEPESSISSSNRKRIDSLGIDDNNCPVIIEYKGTTSKDIVAQVIEYRDLLLNNQDSYWRRVFQQRGKKCADRINWDGVKLICIASDFGDRDLSAARTWRKVNVDGIQLIRFKLFEGGIIHLEFLDTEQGELAYRERKGYSKNTQKMRNIKPIRSVSSGSDLDMLIGYLEKSLSELGHDGNKEIKETCINYFQGDSRRSFLSVVKRPAKGKISLYVKVDPSTVKIEQGFTRNVKGIGHWGSGDLEVNCVNETDIQKAQQFIRRSLYENKHLRKMKKQSPGWQGDDGVKQVTAQKQGEYPLPSVRRITANERLLAMYNDLENFLKEIGGDYRIERTKTCVNFMRSDRTRSFLSVVERPSQNVLMLFLPLDPTTVPLEPGFTRDVKNIGHLGNGDLEIRYDNGVSFEKAKMFIQMAYLRGSHT